MVILFIRTNRPITLANKFKLFIVVETTPRVFYLSSAEEWCEIYVLNIVNMLDNSKSQHSVPLDAQHLNRNKIAWTEFIRRALQEILHSTISTLVYISFPGANLLVI